MPTARIIHRPHECRKPWLEPPTGRPLPNGTVCECECGKRWIVSRSILGAFWQPFRGMLPAEMRPPAPTGPQTPAEMADAIQAEGNTQS